MPALASVVSPAGTESRRDAVRAAAVAALLGLGILWVVGFAWPAVVHDAAHDTRHSIAFPCH